MSVSPVRDVWYLLLAEQSGGPDSLQSHVIRLPDTRDTTRNEESDPSLCLTFISSVLALRGSHVEVQPLVDSTSQSVLCWNGEAWKISDDTVQGNDARHVFWRLLKAVDSLGLPAASCSRPGREEELLTELTQAIGSISGPFSFVFYDGFSSRIFYGRDYLGRRSLLHGFDIDGNFKVSSVCDGTPSKHFEEVGTDGIHVIDARNLHRAGRPAVAHDPSPSTHVGMRTIAWQSSDNASALNSLLQPLNKALPQDDNPPLLQTTSPSVRSLEHFLRRALSCRIQNIPRLHRHPADGTKVALLFSGGLDCTVLGRLAHELLPTDEPIDLLNVAFENPRVAAAALSSSSKKTKSEASTTSPAIYDDCPDRKTGRSSYEELRKVCPGRRWRFISINIPYSETLSHRDEVKRLMRPHNTEMDLSIACALYFAARGEGEIDSDDINGTVKVPYATSARVLLSGLGADEIFAGYTRHATAFSRHGYRGLIDEIELDMGRLGKRNLGRDDRVISHWGREVRYPFLDEEFFSWALRCPVWEKCGHRKSMPHEQNDDTGAPTATKEEDDATETQDLEAGKKALRLVAWNLGMKKVAREKKRAIQFGSRTAKMESGRSKGTTIIS